MTETQPENETPENETPENDPRTDAEKVGAARPDVPDVPQGSGEIPQALPLPEVTPDTQGTDLDV